MDKSSTNPKKTSFQSDLKIRCCYGNPADTVCITKGCLSKNPFLCSFCKSKGCVDKHQACKTEPWTTYCRLLFQKVPAPTKELALYVDSIEELFDRAVIALQKERRGFLIWHRTLGMSKVVKSVFEDIYREDFQKMNGTNMWDLFAEQEQEMSKKGPRQEIKIKTNMQILTWNREVDILSERLTGYIHELYSKTEIKVEVIPPEMVTAMLGLLNKELGEQKKVEQKRIKLREYLTKANEMVQSQQFRLAKTGKNKYEPVRPEEIEALLMVNGQGVLRLDLSDSCLGDISFLPNTQFPNIKFLSLEYNTLSDMTALTRCSFWKLEHLNLSYNQISKIQFLTSCKFPGLGVLNLSYNQIRDISVIALCDFRALKVLNLHDNNIEVIEPLRRIKCKDLTNLIISSNKYEISQKNAYSKAIQSNLPKAFIEF